MLHLMGQARTSRRMRRRAVQFRRVGRSAAWKDQRHWLLLLRLGLVPVEQRQQLLPALQATLASTGLRRISAANIKLEALELDLGWPGMVQPE